MTTNIAKIDMDALDYALRCYVGTNPSPYRGISLTVNLMTWYGMLASHSDDVDEMRYTYQGYPVFIDQNQWFGSVTFNEVEP